MVQYQVGATYKETKLKLDYIPKRYYKFAKLQSLNSKRLIKHILWDYKINLKLKIILKFFLIYKLIEIENLALREFVKENFLKKKDIFNHYNHQQDIQYCLY